ncbi:MAG: tRNA (adenosine(37)-N6)-threonylcarbamoyltransferase complex dimerization subunit type 1 TsaB [Kiritimatiellia bacterium]
MLYIAVEQSTIHGSLALVRGTSLLDAFSWTCDRSANATLSAVMAEWQVDGRLDLAALDCLVVGVGPGSYTGLRTALALFNACALPDNKMVYALSSAETLAWQLAPDFNDRPIMVIGDARRGQLWYRIFRSRGLAPPVAETGWSLGTPAELPWQTGLVAATSDWDRIGANLQRCVPRDVTLLQGAAIPSALSLARLTAMRLVDAVPSEPLAPIYLHAAVRHAAKPT